MTPFKMCITNAVPPVGGGGGGGGGEKWGVGENVATGVRRRVLGSNRERNFLKRNCRKWVLFLDYNYYHHKPHPSLTDGVRIANALLDKYVK